MAFVSKKRCLDVMQENSFKYYKVLDTDKSCIAEQQDPELSEKAAYTKLEEVLEEIEGTWVHVQFRHKTSKEIGAGGSIKSGVIDLKVKLSDQRKEGDIHVGALNQSVMQLMRENAELKTQLNDIRRQHEIDLLKKEFADWKKEEKDKNKTSPIIEQGIGILADYFRNAGKAQAPVTQQAAPAQMPINGPDEVSGKKQKVQDAIKRLSAIDPNLPDTLQMLATYAEKNPASYSSMLPMLKAQI